MLVRSGTMPSGEESYLDIFDEKGHVVFAETFRNGVRTEHDISGIDVRHSPGYGIGTIGNVVLRQADLDAYQQLREESEEGGPDAYRELTPADEHY